MIALKDLSFSYKSQTLFSHLNLSVKDGSCFALLGRNGSGKSTIIKMMAGFLKVTDGEILIQGRTLQEYDRKMVGFVFQDPSLDPKLTVMDHLKLYSIIHGIPLEEIKKRSKNFSIDSLFSKRIHELSGGFKRRLDLFRALLPNPDILILDEPTSGLDEPSFREFWAMLQKERSQRPLTIFLSTHRAEEVEQCDHMAVLHEGKIMFAGSPQGFKNLLSQDIVICSGSKKDFEEIHSAQSVKKTGDEFLIETLNPMETIRELLDLGVSSVLLKQKNVADAFVKLTGSRLEA